MSTEVQSAPANSEERCWRKTGVFGDSTCAELQKVGHCRNCGQYLSVARGLFNREISPELQTSWTSLYAQDKEVHQAETLSVVVFRIKSEWFGLDTSFFKEGVSIRPVHSVPGRTDKRFRGLVNINGELVLCVSLADVLGLAEETSAPASAGKVYPRMLVIQCNRERFAFAVEETIGVVLVRRDTVLRSPETVGNAPGALTDGVFELDKRTVGVLDEAKLFSALEGILNR